MAYDYGTIMQAQYDRINAEAASAAADLEAARLNEDSYSVHDAANRILQLDAASRLRSAPASLSQANRCRRATSIG